MATSTSNTPTRRDALAACGATSLAGLAVAFWATPEQLTTPPTPADAALLRLAAAHAAVERERDQLAARWGHTLHVPHAVQHEADSLHQDAETLREQIAAIPAHTAAGKAAKARIAADLLGEFGTADLTSTDRLLLSLCRDLAGGRA